jgi:hypothetical protein
MSKTYCICNSDNSSYVGTEIPAIVQAPFTDPVSVGLQHFAVLNINEATEDFEVFGTVINGIGNAIDDSIEHKGLRVEPEEHQTARCLIAWENNQKSEMNCACR